MTTWYLERTEADGHFVRVRVIRPRNGLSHAEVFWLGEPVQLDPAAFATERVRKTLGEDKVWWIARLTEERGEGWAWLTSSRYGGHGDIRAHVETLEKLPAMLRIALECAD